MEGESINEVENVSTSNTFITYYLLLISLEKEGRKWHGNQNYD